MTIKNPSIFFLPIDALELHETGKPVEHTDMLLYTLIRCIVLI